MVGGIRRGAGRPKGSGKFKEPTKAIRVPLSQVEKVLSRIQPPLFEEPVAAGFPSPAEGMIERNLDLNELLVKRPAATFFVRVSGDSMIGAGIHHQDILVVDRSLTASSGKIIVASVWGEFVVKRLLIQDKQWLLKSENPAYAPLALTKEMEFYIWGIVTSVIHFP